VLVLSAACDGRSSGAASDREEGGSVVVGIQTDIGPLVPPLIRQVDQKLVADQIFEPLAWLGDEGRIDGGFRPAIADSWDWERDSTALVVRMKPAARWHDGKPVRASDVRFTFSLYTDPKVGSVERAALSRIDSVTVRDSVTAVFWFGTRYPDELYDALARMLILPEHALASADRATLQTAEFGTKPFGSGRFRVLTWDPKANIHLVADTAHYLGRAKLDRIVFSHTPDANALVTRLSAGEVDVADILNAEHFRTLAARPDLKARLLPALDYAFIQFNLRDPKQPTRPHPLFGEPALRRALTMGLDRDRLVRSHFDSLARVALGPLTHAQALADTTIAPIPYDSAAATRLLDSLGWTLPQGKTVRERAGRPLRFFVIVPNVSRNRMALAVRAQDAFKQIGVDMQFEALETNAFIDRLGKRNFDMAFNGTRAEVSLAGLRPYWSVKGADDPSAPNFSSYRNPAFDAHLDSALSARGVSTAREHASQAFATIVADAPAIWVYEAKSVPVMHKRIRPAHMVPGAWWIGIADWTIPADERLPRDNVGIQLSAK
jgi:peptide/nickel transport system substrate-binding protein